jgi:hypothetical protein
MENWNYNFYAVTNNNQLVYGFDDENEVKSYCKKHKLKVFTKNGLKNKKIKANNIDCWVFDNEVPEFV